MASAPATRFSTTSRYRRIFALTLAAPLAGCTPSGRDQRLGGSGADRTHRRKVG